MKRLIANKKVHQDFGIYDTFTGGLVLSGGEVKSIKGNQGSLNGAFLIMRKNKKLQPELWIKHFEIPPYQPKNTDGGYDPGRLRKILVTRKQLNSIERELNNKGTTIVPIQIGIENNKVKIEFALARGKKKFDKRQDLKKRAVQRDLDRSHKVKIK